MTLNAKIGGFMDSLVILRCDISLQGVPKKWDTQFYFFG